jgi:hypothetical protein
MLSAGDQREPSRGVDGIARLKAHASLKCAQRGYHFLVRIIP